MVIKMSVGLKGRIIIEEPQPLYFASFWLWQLGILRFSFFICSLPKLTTFFQELTTITFHEH